MQMRDFEKDSMKVTQKEGFLRGIPKKEMVSLSGNFRFSYFDVLRRSSSISRRCGADIVSISATRCPSGSS